MPAGPYDSSDPESGSGSSKGDFAAGHKQGMQVGLKIGRDSGSGSGSSKGDFSKGDFSKGDFSKGCSGDGDFGRWQKGYGKCSGGGGEGSKGDRGPYGKSSGGGGESGKGGKGGESGKCSGGGGKRATVSAAALAVEAFNMADDLRSRVPAPSSRLKRVLPGVRRPSRGPPVAPFISDWMAQVGELETEVDRMKAILRCAAAAFGP